MKTKPTTTTPSARQNRDPYNLAGKNYREWDKIDAISAAADKTAQPVYMKGCKPNDK